jgi:hypothetical protein
MKKIILFLLLQLALSGKGFATITGTTTVDPFQTYTYNFYPAYSDCITGTPYWTVSAGATIMSQSAYSCTILTDNSNPTTCGIVVTVEYDYFYCSDATTQYHSSEDINLTRYAFMTGPQTVYPGDMLTYTVQDPCNNPFTCTYDWSGTTGSANHSSLVSWHLNGASVQWPTVIPSSTISSGIIGYVNCYKSCDFGGYGVPTYPYPVYMRLHQPGPIAGQSSVGDCDFGPLTYSVAPVVGATYYLWTIPSGWTGSSTTNTIAVTPNGLNAGTISVRAYAASGSPVNSIVRSLTIGSTITSFSFNFVSPSRHEYCIATDPTANLEVNSIAGAYKYVWTYPAGWTGPAYTIGTNTTMNFNGIVQTGTVTCRALIYCPSSGGSKPPSYGPTTSYQVSSRSSTISAPTFFSTNSPTICLTGIPKVWGVNPVAAATGYIWSSSPVYAISFGNISTDGSVKVLDAHTPGMIPISVQAYNACATSAPVTSSIYVDPFPSCIGRMAAPEAKEDITAEETSAISVFPNPASDLFKINITGKEPVHYTITMLDLYGKKIKELQKTSDPGENSYEISTLELASGIYFLMIDNGVKIRKEKVIVNH